MNLHQFRFVREAVRQNFNLTEAAKALSKDHSIQLMYAGQLADTGQVDQGIALAKAQLEASLR